MVKAVRKIKSIHYFHYISILILCGFVVCGLLLFSNSFQRAFDSVRDFGLSVGYFFCKVFAIPHEIVPTVGVMPPQIDLPAFVPQSFDVFKIKMSLYFKMLFDLESMGLYGGGLLNFIVSFCKIMIFILPFILVLILLFRKLFAKQNNKYNQDTKPLRIFKILFKKFFRPFKNWLLRYYGFLKYYKFYYLIGLCIWLFHFNVFTIVIELFAYYFYFVVSFDLLSIYTQIVKLFNDLQTPFKFIPFGLWIVLCLILICKIRSKIGLKRLKRFEQRNTVILEDVPICVMLCGAMGTKKTTLLTDMSLTKEVYFRNKAYEKILENDLKFPFFPWIQFERSLKKAMLRHSVFDLATCRRFVRSKQKKFEKRSIKLNCFGYDFMTYGMTYNDNLCVSTLWDVLEIYAQLYFIYVLESSLIVSNYSVRTDNILLDMGNFPKWNNDFFARDPRLMDSFSRHAHILDFDMLRLGRKIIEKNCNAGAFEFGIIDITEVGKERKNQVELQGIKALIEMTNQKNDAFNMWLKMCRHSATVDNFPFVCVFMDEQRPESLGADVRELCDIIHIADASEKRLALPLFFFENMVYHIFFNRFTKTYLQYRFNRSDNTLFMYLYKKLISALRKHYVKTYNMYGYIKAYFEIESGKLDGIKDSKKYFLMFKKIYAKRFATDCFSDYFAERSLTCNHGLADIETYKTEKADFAELQKQNSYFVDDLTKFADWKE